VVVKDSLAGLRRGHESFLFGVIVQAVATAVLLVVAVPLMVALFLVGGTGTILSIGIFLALYVGAYALIVVGLHLFMRSASEIVRFAAAAGKE
jgi:hypothetical protein